MSYRDLIYAPEFQVLNFLFFVLFYSMKVPKGNPYHSATSGEMAIYCANSLILRKVTRVSLSYCKNYSSELLWFLILSTCQAGAQVDDPVQEVFNGQEVEVWPRLTWKPKWGLTFSEIKNKVTGSCSVSQKSTMVIKGRNVVLEDLSLNGALIIDSVDDAEVCYIMPILRYGGQSCKISEIV